jgi:hypothetical protein
MQLIKKEGVTLAYQDINPGSPPMLFVHGWGCDHTAFAPQAEFFRRSHRVVSVDLRGHGKSDAPHQDYTMAAFADDLAWLCTELALTKPIVNHPKTLTWPFWIPTTQYLFTASQGDAPPLRPATENRGQAAPRRKILSAAASSFGRKNTSACGPFTG